MHETGCSGLVPWDNPEGWDGEGVGGGGSGWGTHVHPWLIHVNVWQKPLKYCKVISLQLKLINFLKNLNIQKTKIMASDIASWQIDRETMETVRDFIWGGSKVTADGDCSHEIKRHLLLGRKAMTNLDSILKSRDITLPIKVHLVKYMVFPVVMYGCENWTIKKAERQRIDTFELWCWRRLFRVPWTARRSNQSILKEVSPEYSLERLMLKLKLQYSGYLMRRTVSLEKTLIWERLKVREGDDR